MGNSMLARAWSWLSDPVLGITRASEVRFSGCDSYVDDFFSPIHFRLRRNTRTSIIDFRECLIYLAPEAVKHGTGGSALSWTSGEGPEGVHPSRAAIRTTISNRVAPKQQAGRDHGAISLLAINQAWLGKVDGCRFRIELEQRSRYRARQMSLQPLSTTANINELERHALLEGKAYIFRSPDGNARQRDALPPPLILVCEGVSNHVSKTYPCQAVLCLKCAIGFLCNQENSLCRFDQDCCPARKWSYKTYLQ